MSIDLKALVFTNATYLSYKHKLCQKDNPPCIQLVSFEGVGEIANGVKILDKSLGSSDDLMPSKSSGIQ